MDQKDPVFLAYVQLLNTGETVALELKNFEEWRALFDKKIAIFK
jgi:hypothetical protein